MIHFTRPVLTSQPPIKKLSLSDRKKYEFLTKPEQALTETQMAQQINVEEDTKVKILWLVMIFMIIGLKLAAHYCC